MVVMDEEGSALTPGSRYANRDREGKADDNALVSGAGTIVEVTKCQQREDTEWVSAFFGVRYDRSALVAGSTDHKAYTFYVEKCLSLGRIGQMDVARLVFELLSCKVSWHFMKALKITL